jgi:hypothetical protein
MTRTTTATDSTSPKRTRFSNDVQVPNAKNPLASAQGSLASAIMSLPASLQAPAKLHAEKILRLYNVIVERLASKYKLEKADQLPQPIRFKYSLKSKHSAAAETPEFKALQANSEQALSDLQVTLKKDMISLAELEIKLLKKDMSIVVLDLLLIMCWTAVFLADELAETDIPHDVKALLTTLVAKPAVKNTLSALDEAFVKDKIGRYQPEAPDLLTVTPTIQAMASDVEKVFLSLTIKPCEAYDSTIARNQQHVRVAAAARLVATDNATAAATAELDMELTVTPAALKSLIASEVSAAIKRSNNRSSNSSRTEKNDRGAAKAPARSAPDPKKKQTPRAPKQRTKASAATPTTTTHQPAPPPPAAAAAAPLSAKAKARAKKQKAAAAAAAAAVAPVAARNNAATAATNPNSQRNSASRRKGRQQN